MCENRHIYGDVFEGIKRFLGDLRSEARRPITKIFLLDIEGFVSFYFGRSARTAYNKAADALRVCEPSGKMNVTSGSIVNAA
jgi:hypothetical protein